MPYLSCTAIAPDPSAVYGYIKKAILLLYRGMAMKKRRILYSCILALVISAAAQGRAASGDAAHMASHLAGDYQTIMDSAGLLSMDACETVVEARLPIPQSDDTWLKSVRAALPQADTAVVSDRYHGTQWLQITAITPSNAEAIYNGAHDILTALNPTSLDNVQLSLNVSWYTGLTYTAAEKTEILRTLFDNIGARTTAAMEDDRMASFSGYSPLISSCALAGHDAMNVTASICDAGPGTVLWIGAPVLTVEY